MGLLRGIKAFLNKGRKLLPCRAKPDEQKAVTIKREERWRSALQSVLRGRRLEESIPEDFGEALSVAADRFRRHGKDLVRKSVDEVLYQIQIARGSGSENLVQDRLERLEEHLSILKQQWLKELRKFEALNNSEPQTDAIEDETQRKIQRRIEEDLKHAPAYCPNRLIAPSGIFIWNAFSQIEVALGALTEIENVENEHLSKSSPS